MPCPPGWVPRLTTHSSVQVFVIVEACLHCPLRRRRLLHASVVSARIGRQVSIDRGASWGSPACCVGMGYARYGTRLVGVEVQDASRISQSLSRDFASPRFGCWRWQHVVRRRAVPRLGPCQADRWSCFCLAHYRRARWFRPYRRRSIARSRRHWAGFIQWWTYSPGCPESVGSAKTLLRP